MKARCISLHSAALRPSVAHIILGMLIIVLAGCLVRCFAGFVAGHDRSIRLVQMQLVNVVEVDVDNTTVIISVMY